MQPSVHTGRTHTCSRNTQQGASYSLVHSCQPTWARSLSASPSGSQQCEWPLARGAAGASIPWSHLIPTLVGTWGLSASIPSVMLTHPSSVSCVTTRTAARPCLHSLSGAGVLERGGGRRRRSGRVHCPAA